VPCASLALSTWPHRSPERTVLIATIRVTSHFVMHLFMRSEIIAVTHESESLLRADSQFAEENVNKVYNTKICSVEPWCEIKSEFKYRDMMTFHI
jgi:hypothetical protein